MSTATRLQPRGLVRFLAEVQPRRPVVIVGRMARAKVRSDAARGLTSARATNRRRHVVRIAARLLARRVVAIAARLEAAVHVPVPAGVRTVEQHQRRHSHRPQPLHERQNLHRARGVGIIDHRRVDPRGARHELLEAQRRKICS